MNPQTLKTTDLIFQLKENKVLEMFLKPESREVKTGLKSASSFFNSMLLALLQAVSFLTTLLVQISTFGHFLYSVLMEMIGSNVLKTRAL